MSTFSKSIFTNSSDLANSLLKNSCIKLGFDPEKVFDSIKKNDIQKVIIKHVFSLTKKPLQHTILAGAIAMWQQYKNSPTNIREYYNAYKQYFRDDVASFFDKYAEDLQKHIQYDKDFALTYFSVGTLISTYLSKMSYDEDPLEIPQFTILRIVVGFFCSRKIKNESNLDWVIKMYKRLSDQEGIFGSPVIFNEGFKEGAPASCIILTIDDSLDDILDIMKEAGLASKNTAGIGCDFSGLRHSKVGRFGRSQGIVPLLKVWDDLTKYINQGTRRPGALTASNRVHHYDTPEFIQLCDKSNEDAVKLDRVNTSLMLSDLFMKRCEENGKWTLFCPKQTGNLNLLHGKEFEEMYIDYEKKAQIWKQYKKYTLLNKLRNNIGLDKEKEELYNTLHQEFEGKLPPREIDSREYNADDIMDSICEMQSKYSMPYIVHGCNTNRKNNMDNVGPVRSMNLCQEITIPAIPREQTGCCVLASMSLKAFAHKSGKFNFVAFGESVQDFIIGLNQVVDSLFNVSEKVTTSMERNRPIGLGVTGYADMFHVMNIPVVDMNKLPKQTSVDDNGLPVYSYVDIKKESPDYNIDSLRERVLNPDAMELTWKIWSCMYYNCLLSSMTEAKKSGPYPNFGTSNAAKGVLQYHLWQKEEKETGRQYPFKLYPTEPKEWGQEGSWEWLIDNIKTWGLRNALLMTCMPSASTAQVLGNSETTEFHMQNIYTRKVLSGDYPVLNFHMVKDFEKIGIWNEAIYNNIIANNGSLLKIPEEGLSDTQIVRLRYLKEKYLTMWEIPQKILIQLAAQRQVFIDQSQSLNIYLEYPNKETLKAIHYYTWTMGLKTGMYYLRTRSASEPMKIGSVGKDKRLSKIESEIRESLYKRNSKGNETKKKLSLQEHYDNDMINLMHIVTDQQEKFQHIEEEIRDKIISKTLNTVTDPKLVKSCDLTGSGDCISCQ